jgi:hypothetical protein
MDIQQSYSQGDIQALKRAIFEIDSYIETATQDLIRKVISGTISQEDMSRELSSLKGLADSVKEKVTYLETIVPSNDSTPDDVKRQIYHLYHTGLYQQANLANIYNVSQSTISNIVNNHVAYSAR